MKSATGAASCSLRARPAPVLAGLPDLDLELVDTRTFDGRVAQLVYLPRGPWRPR